MCILKCLIQVHLPHSLLACEFLNHIEFEYIAQLGSTTESINNYGSPSDMHLPETGE